MTNLKRPAEEEAAEAGAADTIAPIEVVAAPPPSHLFLILTDEDEHEGPRPLGVARTLAGATEVLKMLHEAAEAKRVLKEGEERVAFGGLDTSRKQGKVVGQARNGRVEKWKVTEGKTLATGANFSQADAEAVAPGTTVHYAYTVVHSWTDHYGDTGAHSLGGVVLKPSGVPALVCAKLPRKGHGAMKFPAGTARDGILVAEERDSGKGKGKHYEGVARRWIVRDWESDEGKKKAPARKKAKTT